MSGAAVFKAGFQAVQGREHEWNHNGAGCQGIQRLIGRRLEINDNQQHLDDGCCEKQCAAGRMAPVFLPEKSRKAALQGWRIGAVGGNNRIRKHGTGDGNNYTDVDKGCAERSDNIGKKSSHSGVAQSSKFASWHNTHAENRNQYIENQQ